MIAFDSSAVGALVNPGTSSTWAHTVGAGANPILFVGVFGDVATTGKISGVTYNGVAMTLIGSVRAPSDRWVYLFYLVNPTTGTNNVVVSASASIAIQGMSSSFTGVNQTGQPDASTTNTTGASVSHLIGTLTTVAANCWTVAIYKSMATVVAAGTGTARQNQNSTLIFDSNGPIGTPGSSTLQGNSNSNSNQAIVMASFAPFVAPPTPTGFATLSDLAGVLNQLAGTSHLEAAGAANVYAGTTGLELVGALNRKAGTVGLELGGVCNKLAGTVGLEAVGALNKLAGNT